MNIKSNSADDGIAHTINTVYSVLSVRVTPDNMLTYEYMFKIFHFPDFKEKRHHGHYQFQESYSPKCYVHDFEAVYICKVYFMQAPLCLLFV